MTFTATVTPSAATGTVTFKNGGTTLGTGTLSGGKTTLTISTLAVGSNSITAAYSGDNNYNSSNSPTLTQTVNKATPTVTLTSSANPSTYGSSVTFTATLSPSLATGTVTFKDGSTTLGTGTLSSGVATYSIATLVAGSHSIAASYGGDTNDNSSTSSVLTQTVNKATPTVTLTSSANPSTYGSSVTFTATLSPSLATGTVTFKDGSTTLGTGTVSSGKATYSTSTLTVGSHSITASYGGDTNDSSSTSSVLTQTVNKVNTTITVASSLNPSTYGSAVTFTATVSPSTATGTVTFLDGSTTLGTGTIGSGKATFSISTLTGGTHSITASYGGDANDNSSTSSVLTQTVNKVNTTVTVTSSSNPSTYGSSVTFTATVSTSAATGTVTFKDGNTTLGTGTLGGGKATFIIATLAAGSHSITAAYGGDTNYNSSTSSTLSQTVNKATPTITLASSVNPSAYGSSVTFTATLSVPLATGTVTFKDGSTTLGTGTLSSGVATYSTATLVAGSHSITVSYGGDTNDNSSTSSVLTQTVNKATPAVTLTSSPNPSTYGSSVTFTATLSPSLATGTVTFKDGNTTLGTGTLSGGVATYSTSTLSVGSHSITASYGGDTNDNSSASSILTQTVNKLNTTVTVASSLNPSTYGSAVTFTATVSPSTATGTVTFLDGSTTLGTGTIGSGKATFSISTLTGGTHSITASYGGDANDNSSTSSVLTQTVNKVNTTVTVTSSSNPSTYGSSVTFTATVSPSTATGTVTFKDGSTTLGTGTVSNGVATYTIATLVAGSHSITAAYGGDTNYNGSTSSTLTQTVNKATPTVTLTSSVNPSAYGSSVTFTATLSVSLATGTVTFKDGSTTLGTGTLSVGVATYTIATLAVGSHSITATYSGDANDNGNTSTALPQTVNRANTTVTLTSSANPSTYGASVTFTATVSPSTVTGTVTFLDGSTTLGTGTVSTGVATCNTATLAVGSHSITASYGGDANDNSSTSSVLPQTINKANTTVTLTSSANPSTYGTPVTFTATVSPSTATGTVTFVDGSTTLGTGTVSSGVATYSTSTLTVGSHSITATYGGDANDNSSTSSVLPQTVNKASTTVTLTSSANPSTYGASVTFTATISMSTATGTVTFLDGGTTLGTGTVSSGIATYSTATLAVGSHSITATYSGDANDNSSTSSVLPQTVNKATPTVTLTSSVNPSAYGSSVTFTATLSVSLATGTVTFLDGSTTLGTGTVSSGIAAYSITTLTGGSHAVIAVYGGDSNYSTSTSSTLTQTVSQANSTTTLSSSANPSTYGNSVTFTATVSPANATGMVTFTDGGTSLGTGTISGGSAAYSTSTLAVGAHSIAAVYGGDSNYSGSSSSALTQTINSALQVVTTSLSAGTAGTSYSATLSATGGTVPYAWSVTSGSLPPGLSLNAGAGTMSGIPTVGGTSNFTVQVTDANNNTATQPLSIVIAPIVNALSPVLGPVGTNVTISGFGFGTTQGTSTVAFNGTTASAITSWGATSIVATVPAGATNGNVVVTVGGVSSNGAAFTVGSAYANGYQYRRTITLAHANVPNTDQTDFPVLISGAYSYLANVSNPGGQVQSLNGYDIVFSQDPEGASNLDHEIDSYDPATGTASFWVRIPTLSHSTDTIIYLFYGNPSVTVSQENKPGVWRNGYAGVWHFGSGSLNPNDSTANANNATNHGVTSATGKIGGAGSFDGSGNTYLRIPSSNSFKPATLTLEAWVNMAGATSYPDIFSLDYRADGSWNPPYQAYALDFYYNALDPRLDVAVDGSQVAPNGPNAIAAGQWTHVAGTYDGTNMIVYANGSAVEQIFQDGPISYGTSQDLDIGTRSPYTSAEAVNGLIDEARVSTVARSADWIATEYANESSPSTFYAVEGQETPSSPPTIQLVSPTAGAIAELVTIQGYGFQATQGASTVTFSGVVATPTSWDDASIVVPVPAGATTGNIVVTVGGVASNALAFSVYSGYTSGYQYRRTIVVDHTKVANTDQTDFPILISGGQYLANVQNGGFVQNLNGYDIIFSQDPEGASKLDHEIDSYNPATGASNFWVRIPTLSHTADTVIYLLYGNPVVMTSQENKAGVWRSNYLSVYHLGNGTTVGLTDSGSAGYTLAGSAAAGPGKIGGGAVFNGNPSAYLYYDSVGAYPNGSSAVTLETWFQLASSTGGEEILGYGANSGNGSREGLWWDGSNVMMEFENEAVYSPLPFDSSWHHLVGVYGGGALSTATDQLYLDGAPLPTNTSGGLPAITTTEFKIGGIPTVTSCCALNGSVDEVRVSSGVRSADWVATEYANESSPSTFYTVEGPATASSAPAIQFLSPVAAAVGATITIEGAGFQPTQGGSTVAFNGAAATPTSSNDASIVVPVPAGATTGNVIVTVGGVSSNGASFTVLPTPGITNLNPTSGAIGTLVTITGTSFGSTQGTSMVTFAGAAATPINWSASSITVTVPAGATTGNVIVTAGGGASNPVGFAVIPALSITNISPSSGIVGTYVTISGILFGATQGASTVTLNTASAIVASWSDTSIVAIVPAGASSGPFSVSVNGQIVTSPPFTVTSLPSPWVDVDVGSVSQAGSATFSGGTFAVVGGQSGTGNAGLWGSADGMNFVYRTLSGDGTIVARLTSLQAGVAGVMIRETLNPSATDVNVISSFGKIFMGDRQTTGAGANLLNGYGTSGYVLPTWLQLVREGSIFTGYVSSDGVNWTELGSTTVPMAESVYIGLAVSGYESPATAALDSVSINSAAAPAPVITGLSPTTASIGSQVQVIGHGFGDLQGGSVLLLNDTPLQVNLWGNTGIVFTVPAGATSGPLVVSVAPSMNSSNPANLEVTAQPLPTSWSNQDVGSVGTQTGSSSFSGGIFTVSGGGAGLGGTPDAMQFVYQPLTGDGSIVARLTNLQASQAGVMMRETLNPSAAEAYLFFGWFSASYIYHRPSTGAQVVYDGQPYGLAGSTPIWQKMTRVGNTFTGYVSPDGVNWTQVGSSTFTMAETIYVGLMVSGAGSLGTATFDSVSINSSAAPAPLITGLSATTASVGSQVEITGNNFGQAQGASVLLLNGVPMPVNLWSNTSIVFTIPVGATSGQLLVSVAPSMNDSNPFYLEITGQPLPTPWLNQDVGAAGAQAGSASSSGGTFTVMGGGAGVGGTADGMQFVYQALPGDGSIIARLTNYQTAQAGVMIRETLSPGAADAYIFYLGYPFNANFMYDRPSTGAQVVYDGQPYGFAQSIPEWMELTRVGSTLTGYISSDGVNWTQIGSATVAMAQNVYIGLIVSNNLGSLGTATFDNVTVNIGTTPFVSSVTPIVGTIGTSVTITGSNFGGSQGTSTVKFNGALAASITSWSSSQIVATVPGGVPVGTGPITVTVNSITSPSTASSLFTVVEPVIGGVLPPAGPVNGTLVINGSGFGASQNGVVSINGVTANVSYTCPQNYFGICWTDTQIQVSIPSTTSGPLTVSNDGIVSSPVAFTVTSPPVITGLSPTTGEPTTVITIGGSNFGATQSNSTVAVGGIPAAVSSWSDGQIVATVPNIPMNGIVTVTVAGITAPGPLFVYNAINQLTASNGAVTTYSAGVFGGGWRLYSSAGPGCSTCAVRGNVVNTYDDNGNLLTTTDANGNTVTYTYDGNNNMTSQTAQLNGQPVTTSYTYNNFAEVLSMTDALGNTTNNTYDGHGNLLTVALPAPNGQTAPSVTQFAYDNKGELTQILDPLNHPTTISYYSTGLIQSITDAQNHTTSYAYDSRGNRTSVIDPINGAAHPTTFAYDAMSRLTGITYPDGTTASFGYDTRGRRTSATDQNNKTTTYAYDDANRLISVTDAATNLTQYGYDTEDNLTSITDANNHTTYFAYDTLGRVIQTTFPSTLTETYTYDQLYNLTSRTDRKGQTIQYVYDSLYRMVSKTYPDQTSASYAYDLVGKVQAVTDPTGSYGFAYDNMGRLIGTSTQYTFLPGHNFQNSYSYDAASNRTSLTAPDGSTNTYQYDTLNRLATLTNSLTGQFGFGYDALSRRTQLTRPNGVNTNYNYDGLSHLLSVLHQAGNTTLDGASYGYDYAGNRTSKTNYLNGTTSNYGYDGIYELQQVTQGGGTTESYSYDAVGNRLSSSAVPNYSYNSSNELTSNSSGSYSYDNNGNTLTDASGKSYAWDFEDRLVSAVVPGTGTVTFKYDPLGRRIQKSSPLGTINYLYDGANLLEEANNSGNVLAGYAQSGLIDETLGMLRSGVTSYYQADGLGSTSSLSNSAGALANTYTYDSFGKLTASTGTLLNPFQYTGREFDLETGIYEYRARYYDQNDGRFISEDPIAFRGGVNFYRYVLNNPVINVDPPGLDPNGWGNRGWTWTQRANCFISYYACLAHIADTRQSLDQMTDAAVVNTSDATGSQGGYSNQRLKCGLNQDQNCRDALTRCTKLALTNPFPPPWWLKWLIGMGGKK